MKKDWSFLLVNIEFYIKHYYPLGAGENSKFGWLTSKNPSGLFGRGFTTELYFGQNLFVLVVSRFD
jgi:hypothetical protein